jgi:hypothetical protein
MRIIVAFLVFTNFQLCAQSNIKPFVKVAFYQSYLDIPRVSELEFGAGVQFNDYISAQVNLRGSQQGYYQDPSRSFRFATLSIEPSYRILGKKHLFSPVIAYDAGIEIANNGQDKFIYTSNYFYYPYYHSSYNKYNKGLYFGKAKILLSIQWKGLDFLVGATYNTYFFKFYRLRPEGPQSLASNDNQYKITGTYTDGEFGFGFETSIKYTFPMKKRVAKKAVE